MRTTCATFLPEIEAITCPIESRCEREIRINDEKLLFFRDISKTGLLNFKEEIIIYRVKIFLNFQYNSIRLIEIRGKLYDKYIYFWTNGKDGNNTEDSK